MAEDEKEILSAQQFGRYELLEQLAVGGMAEIFLAQTASIGGVTRPCVIKRILSRHCANRQFVSMFIDEARIMIGLDHPGVVKLYDFGQIDGAYFMALEYVQGFDLVEVMREIARRDTAVEPLAAAFIAYRMAQALHHAHSLCDHSGRSLNVVHRDVSPHNVLLSYAGDVKLTDFGIALAKNKLTHTMPGTVMGKFAYMSPEQAMADPVDARADIFSVGVVLHEMLTGQRLFSSDTPLKTVTRLIEADVEPPSWVRPEVPELLDRVTLRALKRDADDRFQSGAEMAHAIKPLLEAARFDESSLAVYLESLAISARDNRADRFSDSLDFASHKDSGTSDDVLAELRERLVREPNLWTLAAIGERLLTVGDRVRAMATLRTVAAVFAHRGMLIQAVVALQPIRHLCDLEQRRQDLQALALLRFSDREQLREYVQLIDRGETFALLRSADRAGLGGDHIEQTIVPTATPLLGQVSPEVFVALIEVAKIRHFGVGERIVVEGDDGDSLFAIGRGRVVVYTSPPAGDSELGDEGRVYLSSLVEGDCFGEFGFLTGEQRTASVETITDVWLLEITRTAVDELVELTPELAEPLLDFYKERVVELLMAKSACFAVLDPHLRKILIAQSTLQHVADNALVAREGDSERSMFFIKSGEVEIFTERDGVPIFLNKLSDGDFFGEISALMGLPRMANVRAIGDVEVLRIDQRSIEYVTQRAPKIIQSLNQVASQRSQHSANAIAESLELLRRL